MPASLVRARETLMSPGGHTDPGRPHGRLAAEVLAKPAQRALENITRILRLVERMPLARVYHQRRRNPHGAQRMPVLERLRCRTLAVVLADHDQRRGLVILDEIDGRALRIGLRVLVNRGA